MGAQAQGREGQPAGLRESERRDLVPGRRSFLFGLAAGFVAALLPWSAPAAGLARFRDFTWFQTRLANDYDPLVVGVRIGCKAWHRASGEPYGIAVHVIDPNPASEAKARDLITRWFGEVEIA